MRRVGRREAIPCRERVGGDLWEGEEFIAFDCAGVVLSIMISILLAPYLDIVEGESVLYQAS